MTDDLGRLSLNQATIPAWDLPEAIDGCGRAGIAWIGLWRERVAETGLARAVRIVRDSSIGVSSICRGGWFLDGDGRRRRDDNRRAIEEAAALGARCLVLVSGPAPDRNLDRARHATAQAVAELEQDAAAAGVRLAVEPLHPMFCGDRSLIVSLSQALAIARDAGERVGVVIDAYHVWWDPELRTAIRRTRGRILGFHVSDWLVPTPDLLYGRGMMGDGVIDLAGIRREVDGAGYSGPIEVEIFNRALFSADPEEALRLIVRRYLEHVMDLAPDHSG